MIGTPLRPWKGKAKTGLRTQKPWRWHCRLCPAEGENGQVGFYAHYELVHQ